MDTESKMVAVPNQPPGLSGFHRLFQKLPVVSIILGIGLIISLSLAYYFYTKSVLQEKQMSRLQSSRIVQPSIIPTASPTPAWSTFADRNYSFHYPAPWKSGPLEVTGNNTSVSISDPDGHYILAFSSMANINPGTGRPYKNLVEYSGLSYPGNTLTIDGQEGNQVLPRAGSENINGVDFFSRDKKTVYHLELTSIALEESAVETGKQLFAQILATFRFALTPTPTIPTVKAALISTAGWKSARAITFTVSYPPGYAPFTPPTHDQINFFPGDKPVGISSISISRVGDALDTRPNSVYQGGSRRDWYVNTMFDAEHPKPASLKFVDTSCGNTYCLAVYTANRLDALLINHGDKLYMLSGDVTVSMLETIASTMTFN